MIINLLTISLLILVIITALNAFLGYFAYYFAIKHLGAPVAVAFNSTNILFAVIFSSLILGQEVSPMMGLSTIIVFIGLVVINYPDSPKKSQKL